MPDPQVAAKRKRSTEFVGTGCFIQGLALLSPIILGLLFGVGGAIVGIILLVPLFIHGSRKSFKWRCGNCGNPIEGKQVLLCPVCKARLS